MKILSKGLGPAIHWLVSRCRASATLEPTPFNIHEESESLELTILFSFQDSTCFVLCFCVPPSSLFSTADMIPNVGSLSLCPRLALRDITIASTSSAGGYFRYPEQPSFFCLPFLHSLFILCFFFVCPNLYQPSLPSPPFLLIASRQKHKCHIQHFHLYLSSLCTSPPL